MEATGIDMRYTEAYNDNNEYFAKIQPLLGRGEPIEPDIIAPTSWLVNRLITLDWLEKLPIDQVPNAANLRPDLQNPSWDPTGEYSLPWQTGFAGIAYNSSVTGREITSVDDLFDPEFAGRVGALTEMRDTIGVIAMSLGIDISTLETFADAAPAFDKLQEAKDSGQIRRFHGNDYFDDLSNGNLAITIGWSGDVAAIARDNPDVKFVFPESGATSWADSMVVPKGARNIDAAAQWMNFVYDPVQAAQITAWVGYVSPVAGVREEVEKLDPDLANDPLVFPTTPPSPTPRASLAARGRRGRVRRGVLRDHRSLRNTSGDHRRRGGQRRAPPASSAPSSSGSGRWSAPARSSRRSAPVC
jgi:spermidine/putrescine transport system substrate-binding protein